MSSALFHGELIVHRPGHPMLTYTCRICLEDCIGSYTSYQNTNPHAALYPYLIVNGALALTLH